MWQSAEWNGTEAVGRYLVTGGIVLLLLLRRDA